MKPTDHTAMESRRLASRSGHACGREAAAGNVRAVRAAITLLVAGGLLFAMAPRAHAALYKWTDERGVIHYSDKMPPDALNRASVELNRDGTTVRKREQVKPVAQRAPKDETDEQRIRQEERDRVLASRRGESFVTLTEPEETELAIAAGLDAWWRASRRDAFSSRATVSPWKRAARQDALRG